jgi:hypothetical protein
MFVSPSGFLLPSRRKTAVYDSVNGFHIRKLDSGTRWRLDSFVLVKTGEILYVAVSFSLRERMLAVPTVLIRTGLLSRYSDWLWAGRSGYRIPVGGEIFRACPDRPWGPPSLLYNGYWVFPGGKVRPGRAADH